MVEMREAGEGMVGADQSPEEAREILGCDGLGSQLTETVAWQYLDNFNEMSDISVKLQSKSGGW